MSQFWENQGKEFKLVGYGGQKTTFWIKIPKDGYYFSQQLPLKGVTGFAESAAIRPPQSTNFIINLKHVEIFSFIKLVSILNMYPKYVYQQLITQKSNELI